MLKRFWKSRSVTEKELLAVILPAALLILSTTGLTATHVTGLSVLFGGLIAAVAWVVIGSGIHWQSDRF